MFNCRPPTKSVRTRHDNEKELANPLRVFGHMPIDAIAPMHIRECLDIRCQVGKVRANREKALFSHIFNKAREWGYTSAQNPCQGVKGFKETGRDRYVTDDEFERVKLNAHYTVADAMDLALLTGPRPADILKIKRTDIRDSALWIVQNKTGARLGIEVMGELAAVIDRINQRPPQGDQRVPDPGRERPALEPVRPALTLRQGPRAGEGKLSVQGSSGEGRDRHRRPGALAEAASAQESGHDGALREESSWRARKPPAIATALSDVADRVHKQGNFVYFD
jgi:integrase